MRFAPDSPLESDGFEPSVPRRDGIFEAFDNYPDEFPVNQMARIKYQAGDAEERDDFTPEERARILNENKCSEVGLMYLRRKFLSKCVDGTAIGTNLFIGIAAVVALIVACWRVPAVAQQSTQDLAVAAQNPIAAMYSLPFQNNAYFGTGPNHNEKANATGSPI